VSSAYDSVGSSPDMRTGARGPNSASVRYSGVGHIAIRVLASGTLQDVPRYLCRCRPFSFFFPFFIFIFRHPIERTNGTNNGLVSVKKNHNNGGCFVTHRIVPRPPDRPRPFHGSDIHQPYNTCSHPGKELPSLQRAMPVFVEVLAIHICTCFRPRLGQVLRQSQSQDNSIADAYASSQF